MAKYMDYNGVKYFWQRALGRFSKKNHTHTVTGTQKTVATGLTGGSAPTLGTAFTVTQPTSKTVVTSVTNNVPTSIALTDNVLTITPGTACSSSTGASVNAGTNLTIPNVTSVGSMPTASTATIYALSGASQSTGVDVDPSS